MTIAEQLTKIYKCRNLTKEELYTLIEEASDTETYFIKESKLEPYSFFNEGLAVEGLVIDNRPIYIAMIRKAIDGERNIFWTIVNSNVSKEDKITLTVLCKEKLDVWKKEFTPIYATMGKSNPVYMKWVLRLGFSIEHEDNDYITYKLGA